MTGGLLIWMTATPLERDTILTPLPLLALDWEPEAVRWDSSWDTRAWATEAEAEAEEDMMGERRLELRRTTANTPHWMSPVP